MAPATTSWATWGRPPGDGKMTPMALTAQVKDELARLKVDKTSCRKAEVSTLLRFAGGLHIISGRIVIEAELDAIPSPSRPPVAAPRVPRGRPDPPEAGSMAPLRQAGPPRRPDAPTIARPGRLGPGPAGDRTPAIVYEDADILVVHKPAGLLTHGADRARRQCRRRGRRRKRQPLGRCSCRVPITLHPASGEAPGLGAVNVRFIRSTQRLLKTRHSFSAVTLR